MMTEYKFISQMLFIPQNQTNNYVIHYDVEFILTDLIAGLMFKIALRSSSVT